MSQPLTYKLTGFSMAAGKRIHISTVTSDRRDCRIAWGKRGAVGVPFPGEASRYGGHSAVCKRCHAGWAGRRQILGDSQELKRMMGLSLGLTPLP